jgi:hypothetical protein
MFVWGLVSYQHYHLAVYRADAEYGAKITDYRVAVSNKLYHPADLSVSIEGLPQKSYLLSSNKVHFNTAGRIDLDLHIKPNLKQGLHSFLVHAKSSDGWQAAYRVQHFVEKDSL